MKSPLSRRAASNKVSLSKRRNNSARLKHKVKSHVRRSIPAELEVPEIASEKLDVNPVATVKSEILEMSEFEQMKNSTTKREKIGNIIGQETSIFLCPTCSYWNRWVTKFHDHMLGHQKLGASYRCSSCDYAHRFRTRVNFHIRREKKTTKGKSHSKARTILIHPVPADKYAAYRRTAVIEKGLISGRMTDLPSSESRNADDLTNNLEHECVPDVPTSKCENLDDLIKNLEPNFESAPSVERLEREELKLRKEIGIARKAMSESFSNPPETKKNYAANLDRQRLQIDSMKVKIKSMEEEKKSLSSMKLDIQKKMKEVIGSKMKVEYELRSIQCEVLSLQLAAQETLVLPDVENSLLDAEENARCKEKELKRKEEEVELLWKEFDSLKERSEQAEEELAGASQVLHALEGALKMIELESGEKKDPDNDTTREQIKYYIKLEKRLLQIIYLKSLSKVCEQEKMWLDSIQRYEEQEEMRLHSKLSVDMNGGAKN